MKRLSAVFKDLQKSGQQAFIVGHFSLQLRNIQYVTNIDDVHELSKIATLETDSGKNPSRYITEHDRDDVDVCRSVSASMELQSDLLEVIDTWQNLPDSIKAGIKAMFRAITKNPT